ncbi:MAG: M56 family metallopeptidase, partial [Planctomycetota bacterium]
MSLENVLSHPMVERIGWTLIHFLWQGAVLAAVLAVELVLFRRSRAGVRYIAACVTLALMALVPCATLFIVPVSEADYELPPDISMAPSKLDAGVVEAVGISTPVEAKPSSAKDVVPPVVSVSPSYSWRQHAEAVLEPILPYLVLGWLTGVFGLSVWHLGGWTQLQRLRRKMVKPVDASLHSKLKALAELLGICRAVVLMESALVQVPTVVGWVKPVILLPASALTGLSPEQMEAILAHELAHIKRLDYLVNMLQTVVEILGFYHPAVWWVSHKIRVERENCCDDLAVSVSGDRVRYARALTLLEEIRGGQAALAVAASGGSLLGRIRRLVAKTAREERGYNWLPALIAVGLILGLAIPTALALSSRMRPAEEKSIPPPSMRLEAKRSYSTEEPILLYLARTHNGWVQAPTGGTRWILFLRVNGKEHRQGEYPFLVPRRLTAGVIREARHMNAREAYTLDAKRIEFPPGRYRVSYVFKDLDVVRPDKPNTVVHFKEIASNEVQFEVVKADSEVWGETVEGLRMRLTARAGSEYTGLDTLPLLVELQNVSDEAISVSRLPLWARPEVTDATGKKLVLKEPVTISPWEGRTGHLLAGAVFRWTERFDRFCFVNPPKAGTKVKLCFVLPVRGRSVDASASTAPLFYVKSNSIELELKDVPPIPLKVEDVPEQWAEFMDVVYREDYSKPGVYRAIHIKGDGYTTVVGENFPDLPSSRLEVVLDREHLDTLAKCLRTHKVWELSTLKPEDAYSRAGGISLLLTSGRTSLACAFPRSLAETQPPLVALVEEMQSMIEAAVAASKEEQTDWGETVEGLAVRLRPEGPTSGTRVKLTLEARNDGAGTRRLSRSTHGCWLEVDGKWYWRVRSRERVTWADLKPGEERPLAWLSLTAGKSRTWLGFLTSRDGRVQSMTTLERRRRGAPLELAPGRHKVRLAVPAGKETYAYTNVVEIEVESGGGAEPGKGGSETGPADGSASKGSDEAQVEAAPSPQPRFAATLSNGVTVELVGLYHGEAIKDLVFWKPDGLPFSDSESQKYRERVEVYPKGGNKFWRFEYGLMTRFGPL